MRGRIRRTLVLLTCLALAAVLLWFGSLSLQRIFSVRAGGPPPNSDSTTAAALAGPAVSGEHGEIFNISPDGSHIGFIRIFPSQDLDFPDENRSLAVSVGQSSTLPPPDWPISAGLEDSVWSTNDCCACCGTPRQSASTSSTGSGAYDGPGVNPDYPIVGGGSPGNTGTNSVKTPEPASAALLAIALLVMTLLGALRNARTKHI